ncbi:MAG: prepilin-type N-terminal cleavage/methylation domain-containing protein [Acetobacterales bacterium]
MTGAERRQAGLTLIELLVALALLGLIVGALGGALGTGLAGTRSLDRKVERLEEVRLTQATLRRLLESARPVQWQEPGPSGGQVVGFDGARERLDFVAMMPAWPAQGGLHLMRLALEDGRLLLLRRISAGEEPGFDFDRLSERTVLMEGVSALHLSFYGAETERRAARWHDDWQGATALPRLVRIDVERSDGGLWPLMTVAPALAQQPR